MTWSCQILNVGLNPTRFALAVTTAVTGCGEVADAGATRVVADSAGVQIVTIRMPTDSVIERWRHSGTPELSIGVNSGSSELELSEVIGAVRLPDGRIVVGNGGTNELRFYTPAGRWLFSTGGEGEGPGEFRSLNFLSLVGRDTIMVHDGRLQRLSLFNGAGEFLDSRGPRTAEAVALPRVAGVLNTGSVVAWSFQGDDDGRLGIYAPSFQVSMADAWHASSARVIATGRSGEEARVRFQGRVTRAFRPFGLEADVAAGGEFVFVLTSSDDRSIQVFDNTGTMRAVLRVEIRRQPVDAEAVAAWADSWIARYADGSAALEAWWRHGFRETPAPEFVPVFRSLEVDYHGNICAERYPLTMDPVPEYWCFSPEGRFLRSIVLPRGLSRAGPHPHFDAQLAIGSDYVLGVWEDDVGVQYVRLYRLRPQ